MEPHTYVVKCEANIYDDSKSKTVPKSDREKTLRVDGTSAIVGMIPPTFDFNVRGHGTIISTTTIDEIVEVKVVTGPRKGRWPEKSYVEIEINARDADEYPLESRYVDLVDALLEKFGTDVREVVIKGELERFPQLSSVSPNVVLWLHTGAFFMADAEPIPTNLYVASAMTVGLEGFDLSQRLSRPLGRVRKLSLMNCYVPDATILYNDWGRPKFVMLYQTEIPGGDAALLNLGVEIIDHNGIGRSFDWYGRPRNRSIDLTAALNRRSDGCVSYTGDFNESDRLEIAASIMRTCRPLVTDIVIYDTGRENEAGWPMETVEEWLGDRSIPFEHRSDVYGYAISVVKSGDHLALFVSFRYYNDVLQPLLFTNSWHDSLRGSEWTRLVSVDFRKTVAPLYVRDGDTVLLSNYMFWNAPNVEIVVGPTFRIPGSDRVSGLVSPTLKAAFIDVSSDDWSESWLQNTPLAAETYEIVAPRTDLTPGSTRVMMERRHHMKHAFPELAFMCTSTKRPRDLMACAGAVADRILASPRQSLTAEDLILQDGTESRIDAYAPRR
jgi:hypothetical protein